MGNLFGIRRRSAPPSPPKVQITAQDRAVLQLKQQRDRIKSYQKRVEADLIRNKDLAIQLYQNGLRDRALIVMKRKKNMEDIMLRTDKQLETLEQLVADIEYTQIEVSVVEGLKVGTEALKQLTNLMNIDDIQQMMEDNAEASRKQEEISRILQQSSERYDDEDITRELESIIVSQQEKLKDTTETAELPSPPEEVPAEQANVPQEANVAEEGGEDAGEPLIDLDTLPDVPVDKPVEVEVKSKSPKQREARQLEPAQ